MKLYTELSTWWPLFSPPQHYAEEAAELLELLREVGAPPPRTMLELGCGGGSNAYHLKKHYTLTLTDLSPAMLTISRSYNPECEHVQGDMRSLRLNRTFDIVFVHDAVMYMTTGTDLLRAMQTAWLHSAPGGVALFVPDCVRETFATAVSETEVGGEDGPDRGLRCLSWTFDPDPADTTCDVHFAFMLREGASVTVEHDMHVFGLFGREDWLRLLQQAGFAPRSVIDSYGRDIFIARKPEHP
jgi:SAM-dependent methyltransferase